MGQTLTRSNASQQASAILRAWVRQDPIALRQEFEKGLNLYVQPGAYAFEDEQLELLKGVVAKLGDPTRTNSLEPGDPIVRLCMNLLVHLAAQS